MIIVMLLIVNLRHFLKIFGCIRITWEYVENKDSKVPQTQTLTHKSETWTTHLRFEKHLRSFAALALTDRVYNMIFNCCTVFHYGDVPEFIKPTPYCLLNSSFQIFTCMSNSSMNSLLHKSFWTSLIISSGKFCKVELLGQRDWKPEQHIWYFEWKSNLVSCKVVD